MPKFGEEGFDPREMAQRSAEVRREKAHLTELERLRAVDLFKDLIDAAKGQGRFAELPVDKQFAALKLALEYRYGRPRPMSPDKDVDDNSENDEDDGDSLVLQTSSTQTQ